MSLYILTYRRLFPPLADVALLRLSPCPLSLLVLYVPIRSHFYVRRRAVLRYYLPCQYVSSCS